MAEAPQNNNMLEEVHSDLEHDSANVGHNIWITVGIIGVIVLLLGGVGWYVVSTMLSPAPQPVVLPVTQTNTNSVPQQNTPTTVETEGVGKTQIVDEETRRQLEQDASASLRAAQSLAAKEGPRLFSTKLASYMENMRRMRNYLFINVQTLLQGNTEKEKLLSDYMNTLIAENKMAKDRVAEMQTTIALLKTDFTSYQAEQKRYQDAYRVSVSNYDPQGTSDNLEKFISNQTLAGETYARMKALQNMVDIYGKVLGAMDTKMKFIAANKEALLKEVQVVDVKSLEEKLILSEKEWLQLLQQ